MKKKIKLPFIPNKMGIPIYDKVGEELRDACWFWHEHSERGDNLDPDGEHAGISGISRNYTANNEKGPSRKG